MKQLISESQLKEIIKTSVRAVLKEITSNKEELFKRAIDEFGITEDFREAGYILPNGEMLDFSEKNNGGTPGRRSADHRDIGNVFDERFDSTTRYMLEFINAGAVRYMPECETFCFSMPLSPEQKMILRKRARQKNGEIIIDIIDNNGYTKGYKEYPEWTTGDTILNDIDKHFKGKILGRDELMF